jgi:hypothetical protein
MGVVRQIAKRAHHHRGEADLGALGEGDRSADLGGDGVGHLRAPLVIDICEPANRRNAFGRLGLTPRPGVKSRARGIDGGLDISRPRRRNLRDGLFGVR